jgi:hypothetical protein
MAERARKSPAAPGDLAGYSGTPLPKKLRIGEGAVVALLNAPDGFASQLAPLPAGVRLQKRADGAGVLLAFMKPALAREMKDGRTLWLIWPKKASGVETDLSEGRVRDQALATGLVDYKVCAVDATWSGLAFAVRRTKR